MNETIKLEIQIRKDFVKYQKKGIRNAWMLGLMHPALILFCSMLVYRDPTLWLTAVALGINITSFFFYVLTMIDLTRDYKSDLRILEFYETIYKEQYESDNRNK